MISIVASRLTGGTLVISYCNLKTSLGHLQSSLALLSPTVSAVCLRNCDGVPTGLDAGGMFQRLALPAHVTRLVVKLMNSSSPLISPDLIRRVYRRPQQV